MLFLNPNNVVGPSYSKHWVRNKNITTFKDIIQIHLLSQESPASFCNLKIPKTHSLNTVSVSSTPTQTHATHNMTPEVIVESVIVAESYSNVLVTYKKVRDR